MKTDWSSLWKKEDWWAVWLGFITLALAATGVIAWLPKIGAWTTDITKAFPVGSEYLIALGLGLFVLAAIGVIGVREDLKLFALGFPVVFFFSLLSLVIAKQETIGKEYGLEFALWALLLGLLINNTIGTPKWLLAAARTELFIKIGLVLLGAEILFNKILVAGVYGMLQAVIVVSSVFIFSYVLATRVFKIDQRFAAVLSSAVSICGVSAAIAAGGAVKGDSKHTSYTISLVLLLAIPMLVFMPFIAKALGLPSAVAGAWIGGTIDTTPAVVAAGALYSKEAMEIASIVKMSQNVLIGVAAFILALIFAFKSGSNPRNEKPSILEIWYRFPKFVVGFIIASIVFSTLVPILGSKSVDSIISITSGLRSWWFAMAFVSIGLTTKFSELIKIEKGKPFISFTIAQIFNIFLTLALAYVIFGGLFQPAQ
jgi:uncharacterized integral membrane protein (TIGR00698 family)